MSQSFRFALAALALGLLAGCGGSHRAAQSPDPEYSDEAEYANTPTRGPGSESSTGYYGVGNSGGPARTPASPRPGN